MADALPQVVILNSKNEDIFVCGVCKTVFNSLDLFLEHKSSHCEKQINCKKHGDYDNNELKSSSDLLNITKEHGILACEICNRKFKKIKTLQTHLKSHERLSQCPVCGRCFESNSHLKRHIATHRVWPDGLNETTPKTSDVELLSYSCSYCGSVLSNYSQFRVHLNSHLSLKRYKCIQETCNYFFDTVGDLLSHVAADHNDPKYTCHICKKTLKSLEDIAVHYRNHRKTGDSEKIVVKMHQYKCSQCDATFRKQEKLSLHLLTENHNKPCIHCNKIFASAKRLRMHLQIHRKSKPYECNICGTSFQMKKYLTSHLLRHGESRFTCEVCKSSFKRKDVLRRHSRTHLLRKSFKCPFKDVMGCTREFSRKDKLNEHLTSHTKNIKLCDKQKTHTGKEGDNTMEICIVPIDSLNFTFKCANTK